MTRGRPGPPGALAPSSGPSLHTTPDWDRRRPWRWLGNYEKLASSGCPSLRMKPTLDKSYSPCSEGYSCVTTRYRDQELPVDRGSAWVIWKSQLGARVKRSTMSAMYLGSSLLADAGRRESRYCGN